MPERLSRFLSWAVPFAVALFRCSPFAQWRADTATLRDVALLPMGFGGGVSTALTQLAQLAPLGSRTLRAAFPVVLQQEFDRSLHKQPKRSG